MIDPASQAQKTAPGDRLAGAGRLLAAALALFGAAAAGMLFYAQLASEVKTEPAAALLQACRLSRPLQQRLTAGVDFSGPGRGDVGRHIGFSPCPARTQPPPGYRCFP